MKYSILVLSLCLGSLHSVGAEIAIDQLGLRVGIGSENGGSFTEAEALAYLDYKVEWALSEGMQLEVEPEISLGAIDGLGDTAGLVHFGFAAFLEIDDFPLTFVGSSGPTFLTDDEFGNFDLGSHLQFTSAFGFDIETINNWTLGYRYQHISNGGLDDTNPGLNLHVLAIARDF